MTRHTIHLLLFLLATLTLGNAQNTVDTDTLEIKLQPFTPDNKFLTPGWHNWGGSIIQGDDGIFRLFYSRWPVEKSFYAWLTHCEIAVATSPNSSGPWTYQYTALSSRDDGWDAITAHNPKIKKFDGKYYLYYISTSGGYNNEELTQIAQTGYSDPRWPVLRNNQLTGVAQSDSLDGPWTRKVEPLLEIGPPLHNLIVNPAITRGPDGRFVLMVKGDKAPGGGQRIQAVATGNSPEGPFTLQPEPAIKDFDTEDASIWYDTDRARFYAIFHAHTYYGMITSVNGINWNKANSFNIGPKSFQQAGGGTFATARMERPNVWIGTLGVPEVFSTSFTNGSNQSGVLTIPIANPSAYDGGISSDFDPKLSVSSMARWHDAVNFSKLVTGPATAAFAFHTNVEVRPWVQLDFEKPTSIDSLVVDNRSDELQSRARNLALKISDDGTTWTTIWEAEGNTVNQWTIPLSHTEGQQQVPGITARYMRFFLNQDQPEAFHLKRIRAIVKLGTDSDADGLADAWEMSHFSDLSAAGIDTDTDGNGVSDLMEFHAGTNPNDPEDYLRIVTYDFDENTHQITFSSVHTRRYTIQTSGDLENWSALPNLENLSPDAGAFTTKTLPTPTGSPTFYRVLTSK